ncbi:ankyrin repeat domain-containing protein [Rhodopirellula bahusiensis]|uniref:Uncharacterized protein n=1 Tax=Rhodopirellula bahusiensis TaxID=2014065 RepID=A0A2G1W1T7_9BACT|nr:ankyrin repeat domain-containing protein [Rhodopirellula bahusiensis]PHQ32955.1 hypothetical protein CEE69_23110 [Rhodopirellula bahusiensis]
MSFMKQLSEFVIPFLLPTMLAVSGLPATTPKVERSTVGVVPAAVKEEATERQHNLHKRLLEVNPNWAGKVHEEFDRNGVEALNNEVTLLQKHFELVIARLNAADISDLSRSQLDQRSANIQRLRDYMVEGDFPQNIFVPGRRPVFIDPWGTHCAVGHLIATSGHADLAQRINREHRLDVLKNIQTEGLGEWQLASGLRLDELVLIQPHYQFRMRSQTIEYPAEIEALVLGDSSAVLEALKAGELKVGARCGGKTLLHFAAASGDLALVKRLVDMGADLNGVSTLGCDEDEIAKGGKHSRFEVRWDGSTRVTSANHYLSKGRVYKSVRGSFVADVLQDFYGGMDGKNALEYATSDPRPSKHGVSMHAYYGKRLPFGNPDKEISPLDEVKNGRAEVAKWLREQGLK